MPNLDFSDYGKQPGQQSTPTAPTSKPNLDFSDYGKQPATPDIKPQNRSFGNEIMDAISHPEKGMAAAGALIGKIPGFMKKASDVFGSLNIGVGKQLGEDALGLGEMAVKSPISLGAGGIGPNPIHQAADFMEKVTGKKVSDVTDKLHGVLKAKNTSEKVGKVIGGIASAAIPIGEVGMAGAEERAVKKAVDAITIKAKDLTAGELEKTLAKSVSSKVAIFDKGGLIQKTELNPTKWAQEVGAKFKDYLVSKSPTKNLHKLKNAMTDVSGKLDSVLEKETGKFDKTSLNAKLEQIKKEIPVYDEIGMKQSKAVINQAVNDAKKVVDGIKTEVIKGAKEARTAFDQLVEKKYPKAFKGGGVDVSTPSGYAIKTVRDAMNDFFYSAVESPEAKALVEDQHNIFRMGEVLAKKAVKAGEMGENEATRLLENVINPITKIFRKGILRK